MKIAVLILVSLLSVGCKVVNLDNEVAKSDTLAPSRREIRHENKIKRKEIRLKRQENRLEYKLKVKKIPTNSNVRQKERTKRAIERTERVEDRQSTKKVRQESRVIKSEHRNERKIKRKLLGTIQIVTIFVVLLIISILIYVKKKTKRNRRD